MDISHIKKVFIEEAESLLSNFDNVMIELEKTSDSQYVNEVFRIIHTIKGACGMFGFEKVVEITHEVESLYDLVRNNKLPISQVLLDITFTSGDHIRALLYDEPFSDPDNIKRHKLLMDSIQQIKESNNIVIAPANPNKPIQPIQPTQNEQVEKESVQPEAMVESKGVCTWNIIFYPDDELIRRCVNMTYTFQDLFALGAYKISNHPFTSSDKQFWSIFLVTDQPYEEIENALIFVLDYCKITKTADFDIFEPGAFKSRDSFLDDFDNQPLYSESEQNEVTIEPIVSQTVEPVQPLVPKEMAEKVNDLQQNINDLKGNAPVLTKSTTTRINVESSKLDTLMYLVSELVTTKSELLMAIHKQNEQKTLDAAEKIEKLSKLFSDNALDIRLVSLHEMLNKFKRLIRDLSKQLAKNINFEIIGEDTELDKNIIDIIDEPIMHLLRNNVDHGIEMPEKRLERGKPEAGTIRFEAEKVGNYVYITISDDGNGINTEYIYNKAVEKGFIQPGTTLSEKEILELIFLPGFSTAQSLSNISGRGVGMDIVLKKIQSIRGEISISSKIGLGTSFTIKLQQTISIIDTLLVEAGNITYAIPIEDIESCLLEAHENIANRQSNLIVFDNELIPYVNLCEKSAKVYAPDDNEKLVIIKRQEHRYAIITDAIIGEYQAVVKPLGATFANVKFLSGASLLGDGSIALLIDSDKLWLETALN